jgi:hypothetical protein
MGAQTHPDLPGRKPMYGSLGEATRGEPSKKYPHADNLQEELNQGKARKYKEGVPKLGREMGNR